MTTTGTVCFVYGTLMRGERNHRVIQDAEVLGLGRTEPRFTLYDLGAYPGAVLSGGKAIVGELYEVTDEILEQLDRLEGHPRFYRRRRIRLAGGLPADVYLLTEHQIAGRRVIESGDWRKR